MLQARQDKAGPDDPVVANRALLDNFDDPEGYYNFQVCLPVACLSGSTLRESTTGFTSAAAVT